MTIGHTSPAVEIRKRKIVYSVLQVTRTVSSLDCGSLWVFPLQILPKPFFPPPHISFFLLTSFGVTISPRTQLQNTPDTFFQRNVFLKLYIFQLFCFFLHLFYKVQPACRSRPSTHRDLNTSCVLLWVFFFFTAPPSFTIQPLQQSTGLLRHTFIVYMTKPSS